MTAGIAFGASSVGTAGADTLLGTAAADQLYGYDGSDTLIGLEGDDDLDGGLGGDVLRGGGGIDAATYAGRAGAVAVTIDGRADDGEAGEGDNVSTDIEDVFGGEGPDNLTGSGAANLLDGAGGGDLLVGGGGADQFFGGAGDDEIQARDGVADVVECGSGSDRAAVDTDDVVGDCEYATTRVADAALSFDWVAADGGVRFVGLALIDVRPRGEASIRLLCAGCSRARLRPDRRDRVDLLRWFRRRDLRYGSVVTIEVSAPKALAKRWRLTVSRRTGRPPVEVQRVTECVWPGEGRARPCSR